jgi:PAS domain S-box-containing protein
LRYLAGLDKFTTAGESLSNCRQRDRGAKVCSVTEQTIFRAVVRTETSMSKKLTKSIAATVWATAEADLLRRIIRLVNEAEDIDSAFATTLREMCEAIRWAYGEVWIPHPHKAYLEVAPAWYTSSADTEIFRKISEEIKFKPGIGLPGRAWESRAPAWVRDVTQDANFPRWSQARAAGLRTGVALPVLVSGEVAAVLNLLTTEIVEEDEQLIELISAVATALGLLIRCLGAEDARQQSVKDFQWLFKNVPDAILIFEPKYQIVLDANQRACEIYGFKWADFIGLSLETLSRDVSYDRSLIKKALDKGQLLNFEIVHFHKSGAELFLKTDIAVINYQGKQAILTINRENLKQ